MIMYVGIKYFENNLTADQPKGIQLLQIPTSLNYSKGNTPKFQPESEWGKWHWEYKTGNISKTAENNYIYYEKSYKKYIEDKSNKKRKTLFRR